MMNFFTEILEIISYSNKLLYMAKNESWKHPFTKIKMTNTAITNKIKTIISIRKLIKTRFNKGDNIKVQDMYDYICFINGYLVEEKRTNILSLKDDKSNYIYIISLIKNIDSALDNIYTAQITIKDGNSYYTAEFNSENLTDEMISEKLIPNTNIIQIIKKHIYTNQYYC